MHDGYPYDIGKRVSEAGWQRNWLGIKGGMRIWLIIMTAVTRVLC